MADKRIGHLSNYNRSTNIFCARHCQAYFIKTNTNSGFSTAENTTTGKKPKHGASFVWSKGSNKLCRHILKSEPISVNLHFIWKPPPGQKYSTRSRGPSTKSGVPPASQGYYPHGGVCNNPMQTCQHSKMKMRETLRMRVSRAVSRVM